MNKVVIIHQILRTFVKSVSDLRRLRLTDQTHMETIDVYSCDIWCSVFKFSDIYKAFHEGNAYIMKMAFLAMKWNETKKIETQLNKVDFVDLFLLCNCPYIDDLFIEFGYLDKIDKYGNTAFICSCYSKLWKRANYLLSRGANPNLKLLKELVVSGDGGISENIPPFTTVKVGKACFVVIMMKFPKDILISTEFLDLLKFAFIRGLDMYEIFTYLAIRNIQILHYIMSSIGFNFILNIHKQYPLDNYNEKINFFLNNIETSQDAYYEIAEFFVRIISLL